MTDRELLELAAKAVGVEGLTWRNGSQCFYYDDLETGREEWNPLDRDGQALRLAIQLFIQVRPELHGRCNVQTLDGWMRTEAGYESTGAATRRAIVRAAAEMAGAAPAHPGEGEKPCN